ncbi:hypothetical protein [Alkalibacillus almallahensis]|uniref:hypothetical protein n=1 Tax=Alkalibacillus almallahensis TaxID=1379154 RepID=UPI00141DB8C5|nr:hypothetical protein [Alkalibacillus almallahensis]NIK11320.1 cell division protein FtsB [Alkalibacillus almallahensis]
MRLIGLLFVLLLIFQFGFQMGDQDNSDVVQNEQQISEQDSSFQEQHQQLTQDEAEDEEGLFYLASRAEHYIKELFTLLFHFVYRLAVSFG